VPVLNKSARLLVGVLAAFAPLAGALLVPLTAEAAPKRIVCRENVCRTSCTQQLPNGEAVYYDHGTRITIRDKDGKHHEFVCNDGKWEPARTFEGPGPRTLGNIGVGAIAGVKGEVTTSDCTDGRQTVCATTLVGPPGRLATAR